MCHFWTRALNTGETLQGSCSFVITMHNVPVDDCSVSLGPREEEAEQSFQSALNGCVLE